MENRRRSIIFRSEIKARRAFFGPKVVDLDLPPAERWAHLVGPLAGEIRTMIKHFKSLLGGLEMAIEHLYSPLFNGF